MDNQKPDDFNIAHGGDRVANESPTNVVVVSNEPEQDLKLDLAHSTGVHVAALRSETTKSTQPISIKSAAQQFEISRATAAFGKRVAELGDNELLDAVKQGDISLVDAYQISKSPQDQQRDYVRQKLSDGKAMLLTKKPGADLVAQIAKRFSKDQFLPDGITAAQRDTVFSKVVNAGIVSLLDLCVKLEKHPVDFTVSLREQLQSAHSSLGRMLFPST
jgi:hypothetical protein